MTMPPRTRPPKGPRRPPPPLGRARLEEMALAYVARFATSAGKLEAYLARKLRERGWEEGSPDSDGEGGGDEGGGARAVAALVEKCVANGWVDDAGWARMKAESLTARGYGGRRIADTLRAGGIAEPLRAAVAPGEAEARAAAVRHARRRRLGPFGPARPADAMGRAKLRQKQLAAMLRAGHDFATAAHVIDAATAEEIEEWAAHG